MKIVLDSNVLISAFAFKGFSTTVYQHCIALHEVYISDWILEELSRTLLRKFDIQSRQVTLVKQMIIERSTLVLPDIPLPTVCRDADDNHVLQLAQQINAHVLVSGDKDLLDLKQYIETTIVSPRQYYSKFVLGL